MKKTVFLSFLLISLCLRAQEPCTYFTVSEMPDALYCLPAPPQREDAQFAYDSCQYEWGKSVRNTPRGDKARLDGEYSIQRMAQIFSPILGIEISQTNTPHIWKLLIDATKTADFTCRNAKKTYMRPRPFMVFNEPTLIPEEEENLRKNGSYPSGHTMLGWSSALVLCEVAPSVQNEIIKEGYEYGQSRVIAGFHWQSDVDVARLAASVAFARLHTSKAYLKQLHKAQKEYHKLVSH